MKNSLSLGLSQQLTLTPQLQQAIRLLQLSSLDLNQEIQALIETNPLLDVEEDKLTTAMEAPWQQRRQMASGGETTNLEQCYAKPEKLQDYLRWQLELSPFSETDQAIALAIIDSINSNGLLTCTLEDIQISLPDTKLDEMTAVLHRIQRFDPVGCGARDLAECLRRQLEQLDPRPEYYIETILILDNYIDLLAAHNYRDLLRKTKLDDHTLAQIIQTIQQLNPRPGMAMNSADTEYVIPDVMVTKSHKGWHVTLNPDALPRLTINQGYAGLANTHVFIKDNLQEARWFIKSLQSRNDTLLRVASKIIEVQQGFLEHGDEAMKPLVLHNIAEALDLHESTVSRVTTQKYMHTPRGVFELKYFFSSHVQTANGGECSSTAIRALIKKLIAAENSQKPLSDNKIAQIIGEQGIKVARRTIAKYREAMNIVPSNERKTLVFS